MKRFRVSIGGLLAAAFVSAAMSIGAVTASAQLLWNPPCGAAKIINCTTCTAILNLSSNPALPAVIVPAGTTVSIPTGPAPLFMLGVISQAGVFVPIVLPPPVIIPPPLANPCVVPPPGPMNGVVRSITLGPPPGCCFDVYFNVNSDPNYPCVIFLYPAAPPCRNP